MPGERGRAGSFQPVFDRLGQTLREADTNAGWLTVDRRVRYDVPSEVVLVRRSTGRPRPLWALLVLVPLGHVGDERIDPEVTWTD
ncbi:hypothetical protein ACQP2Y_15375 [Actinoplanes sp. CA-051413]|uniref:hypothetical protein n=1 Tax=Actinoplanes sp. CA-051413 TaxID=3239899 RepID=UPI003D9A038E